MTLIYGEPGTSDDALQLSRSSTRPFPEVLEALRSGIAAAGMKVLHEIDPQAALGDIGEVTGGSRLVFFFHPKLLAQLLRIDVSAIVEAPLKLAVIELQDGTVSVRMTDPAAAFRRYGAPAMAAFGQDLATKCKSLIESVL